jgi:RNA polymerase sigma-70 factor (ECF subfamily)
VSPANSAAIASIWTSDYKQTVSRARRALNGDTSLAEDVVMQSFAQLGEQMEREVIAQPRHMLQLITQRRITDSIRAKRDKPTTPYEAENTEQDSLGATGYLAPDNAFPVDFDLALRALPQEEREAFILTELRGLTVREAADVLGTSKSDVDRRASSARTSIRKELAA